MKSFLVYPSLGVGELVTNTDFPIEASLCSQAQRHLEEGAACILARRNLTVRAAHELYVETFCEAIEINLRQRGLGDLTDEESAECSGAAWKAGKAEVLTTRGRLQKHLEDQRFEERLREDASARRMLAFVLCICLVVAGILLCLFVPPLWHWLLRHFSPPPAMLLSSALLPTLRVGEETSQVPCKYCGRVMRLQRSSRPYSLRLVDEYSAGCLCRQTTSVLQGMIEGRDAAFAEYHTFMFPWYIGLGEDDWTARELCDAIHAPLIPAIAEDIRTILAQRSAAAPLERAA